MPTAQIRLLLLAAGRRSTALWLVAGRLSDVGLRADTYAAYDRLSATAPWPDQRELWFDLAFDVLPAAAVYTALIEHGRTSEEAVAAVTRALMGLSHLPTQALRVLLRTPQGRRLFMRYLVPAVKRSFPAAGFDVAWGERSPNRITMDVTRCFFVDMTRRLGTLPAALAWCAMDEAVSSSLSPHLRYSRSATLAMGAPRCEFCFALERDGGVIGAAERASLAEEEPLRSASRR
jgi:L-2-amino-thiazoline-4-carboxylic acid hydrolase-like protein